MMRDGKTQLLSLDTHKNKTTFTLTTKIVLRFSTKFIDKSVAARVRARCLQLPSTNSVPNESIADRVAC